MPSDWNVDPLQPPRVIKRPPTSDPAEIKRRIEEDGDRVDFSALRFEDPTEPKPWVAPPFRRTEVVQINPPIDRMNVFTKITEEKPVLKSNDDPRQTTKSCEEDWEMLQLQLTACFMAAEGSITDLPGPGDPAWTPALNTIMDLRMQYELLRDYYLRQTGRKS